MIHVAGNSVLDMPLRGVVMQGDEGADGWSGRNVQFLADPVEAVLGGCGGATAWVLGRLGEQVYLNTCVGEDALGRVLRGWFDEAGVSLMSPAAASTAVNVIALDSDGSRRAMYYTGEKVEWLQSLEGGVPVWFFASGYGQVNEGDLKELVNVFEVFRTRGTKIMFDPGPWFMACTAQDAMREAWAYVDCLVGTEEELCGEVVGWCIEDLVVYLLDCGPAQVVVKRGSDGAAFGERGEFGQVPAKRVARAYTVGAGDTFNAGLLHGLSQGETLLASVEKAVTLASRAVRSGRGALGAFDPV